MKIVKCLNCGNTKEFHELVHIVQYNYFHQEKDGRIEKVSVEQSNDPENNSTICCSVCNEEIDDDYNLFLDRYTESIFIKAK
jgi:5-methylcytosine-specific restriction endonuclease McrA